MKQLVLSEWLLTELNHRSFPARMPAHRRIYEAIRRAITDHVLSPGTRLPSTRSLAEDLTVSRNTILAAFEQLLDEGYVAAQTGSGTYVAYNQPDGFPKTATAGNPEIKMGAKAPQNTILTKPTSSSSEPTVGLSRRGLDEPLPHA